MDDRSASLLGIIALMIKERNLESTMRDGTVLRADAYRSDAEGPFPTILMRTADDKQHEVTIRQAERMADAGYLVVIQDVRGRYASDGELKMGFFSADVRDAEDGFDSVEWAASLPASNGRVGTFGWSYGGWTQWRMAHTRPPHLVTMIPAMITANLLDRELSGVLRLGRVLTWCATLLSIDTRNRFNLAGNRLREDALRLFEEIDRSKWLWYLPLSEMPDEALAGTKTLWLEWLADHTTDTFGFTESHPETDVPTLSLTGWYDQQIGAIKNFTGMRANGMTEESRQAARLIIGPWTHSEDLNRQVGEIDFGAEAERDFFGLCLEWFDYWLKQDGASPAAEWPPIQLFVMGENRWRSENEWPLARTRYVDYYLHSDGGASTPGGDGVLSTDAPSEEPQDGYEYDPRDPLMTLFSPLGQQEPHDQRILDSRRDVLVYQTPPLHEAVEVTGPITVKLFAASSALDTDWVVKLHDVWPDGFTQELCHGILRARYRNGLDAPELLTPGETYEFNITANPTSNLFKAGHRMRLDVTSSDFPNFDRNHNTGGEDHFESALVTARQTVYHDAARPSTVTLPMITR